MAEGPTYSREEMDAILKRALERQSAQTRAKTDGVEHEDLVAAAAEVGIPREEVEAAAKELSQKKRDDEVSRAQVQALERSQRKHVRAWFAGLGSWAVMSVFFYVLCLILHQGWWIWPVLGWGLGIALSGVRLLAGGNAGTDDGQRMSRHQRREARRQARRERHMRKRQQSFHEFEERVTVGAEALFRVIDQVKAARERVNEENRSQRVRVEGGGAEMPREDDASADAKRQSSR